MRKQFATWICKEGLSSKDLKNAIEEVENGLIDADMGSGLIKKRVAKKGRGKSGGYRTLLAYKNNHRAIFLFGFEKNEMDNISATQKSKLKAMAKGFLKLDEDQISTMIKQKLLTEVK